MKSICKYYLLTIFLVCFLFKANAQITNISGIINSYASVAGIGSQSISVPSSSGFLIGDKVLLIQMKGTTIDTSNTLNFGTINTYNDAGNYEMLVISSISSSTIIFTTPISRTYNTIGLVQLVKVPVYNNVNVIGVLTCSPWNGQTGGVLALEANGNVTLNANIDVSGKGFLGGAKLAGQLFSCAGNTTSFKLPNTSLASANKGEGIAITKQTFTKGLGPLGNGGGAGNDVNGGGAGGGNFGIGGHGGNSKCSSSPIALCGGYNGKSCAYSNVSNKIFLGGGGGAGHENDGVSTGGVSGGGIIMIRCSGIAGNGNFLNANGNNNTLIAGNDGQGGGGAGGTVLIDACSTSSLNISVQGGNGGTDNFSGPDCHGKGGGGGGGIIWTSSVLTYNSFLNGGNPGLFTNPSSQCFNTSNGATVGQTGGVLSGLAIPGAVPITTSGSFSVSINLTCLGNNNATAVGTLTTSILNPVISYSWTNSSGVIISQTNSTLLTNTVTNLTNGIYTLVSQIDAPCGPVNSQTVNVNCIITPTVSQICPGSLLFDATHPAVDLPVNNQYYSGNNGGYTWECWFKLNQPFGTDMRPLISSVDGVLFEDQWLGFGWQGGWFNEPVTKLVFKVDGPNSAAPTGPNCSYAPPGGFIIGTWYHAAGVMDYTNQISKLYVNGILVDTKMITTPPITRVIPTELCLNWANAPLSLFGNMDEVRIWTRALPATEILTNYNQCLIGNEQDLILYYRCNQPGGTTVIDATANNNTGTFSNLSSWSTQQPNITGTACANSGVPFTTTNSNSLICSGETAALTANGALSYTWSTGATSASIAVSPTVTSSYTVSGIVSACSGINNAIITVSVIPVPIITVTGNAVVCFGSSATIMVNGANTYTWSNNSVANSINVSPPISTTYSVIGTIGTCTNSAVTTVSILPTPTIILSPNTSICGGTGASATLTASGANSYTWNSSVNLSGANGSIVTATPNVTETYTVTGELSTCTGSAVTTVSVMPSPTISLNSSSTIICPSSSVILNATGATNYTWSPASTLSSSSGTQVIASPNTTTTYSVFGTNSTCTNVAQTQVVVTVTNNPVIASNSATICSTTSTNLIATGGVTYTWSPTANLNTTLGSNVISTPPSSVIYTISGSSSFGCIGSTSVSVFVIPTPTISISSSSLIFCYAGGSSTLTATGANSYSWTPAITLSNVNTPATVATPINTTIYTVIGANGISPDVCTSSNTVQINIGSGIIPIVSPNDIICLGQSTTIYAIGGNTYHWIPTIGVVKPNESATIVKPGSTTIYTVFVSNNNICPVTGTVEVDVKPLPIVNAGRDTTVNIDETITLIGIGNVPVGFISSSNAPLTCNFCSSITVNPQENTCYVLMGRTEFNCVNYDEVCVKVNKDWDIFIPNTFTPNGDGKNDYFVPYGYAISEINLLIFDRWGHEIFKEDNTKNGWDGKQKGTICKQGVYIYQVEIKTMSGLNFSKTGHVNLLPQSQ
jgi:gliding motility-associated-like protein